MLEISWLLSIFILQSQVDKRECVNSHICWLFIPLFFINYVLGLFYFLTQINLYKWHERMVAQRKPESHFTYSIISFTEKSLHRGLATLDWKPSVTTIESEQMAQLGPGACLPWPIAGRARSPWQCGCDLLSLSVGCVFWVSALSLCLLPFGILSLTLLGLKGP